MKRAFSLFLVLALSIPSISFAEEAVTVELNGEEVMIPIMIPSLGKDLNQTVTDTVKFIEVKDDKAIIFEEPDNILMPSVNTVNTAIGKPAVKRNTVVAVAPSKSVVRNYVRIYGKQEFSPLYFDARVHDWLELDGSVARSFYSDSQRSSRINEYYGKIARLRYYPSLRSPKEQLAGVYEYNSELLTQ